MHFKSTTANFNQIGDAEPKVVGVQGILLSDGSFIFTWIDGDSRKMVLTENDGTHITSGFLAKHISSWSDERTWDIGLYEINNFQGIVTGRDCVYLVCLYIINIECPMMYISPNPIPVGMQL